MRTRLGQIGGGEEPTSVDVYEVVLAEVKLAARV
jgi:hypothetical protein